jgi:hypothetical protein
MIFSFIRASCKTVEWIVSGCKRERDRVTTQEVAGLGMLYA